MTKKDYVNIANCLVRAHQRLGLTTPEVTVTLDCVINELADLMEEENSRFDRKWFVNACHTT